MAEESGKKLITPLIFNDEPVGRDETAYFQFEHYADTFARIIAARDTRTPLTIGVHGEWGSGKTTLMRCIQAKLDEIKDKNWKKTKPPSFVTVGHRPNLLLALKMSTIHRPRLGSTFPSQASPPPGRWWSILARQQ